MFEGDTTEPQQRAFTGELLGPSATARILAEAHRRYRDLDDGEIADYIPILAEADPTWFALVCQARSHEFVHERIGVNNTGLPFNSVMAIELNDGHPMNSMVNAGALARLLESYGRIITDPLDSVDIYTRQCSLSVSAHDLAVMGSTLADGGANPVTGERVVSAEVARDTLALLASCGMYENSGEWLFEIGLPAKSGVAGGIVAIAPGKGALGTFSPQLDSAGNSVRGQRACFDLSRALGLNLFASTPAPAPRQR